MFSAICLIATAIVSLCFLLCAIFAKQHTYRSGFFGLVLTEYTIQAVSPPGGPNVLLVGRPLGFISWLLSLIGHHDEVEFEVNRASIVRRFYSGGFTQVDNIPIRNVARTIHVHSGAGKGFWLKAFLAHLLIWILVLPFVGGAIGLMFFAVPRGPGGAGGAGGAAGMDVCFSTLLGLLEVLFIGLVMLSAFWSKRVRIGIETNGGVILGVEFIPGLLEGKMIDFDETTQVVDVINSLATAVGTK